jgi:hypothetical protein
MRVGGRARDLFSPTRQTRVPAGLWLLMERMACGHRHRYMGLRGTAQNGLFGLKPGISHGWASGRPPMPCWSGP